MDRSHFLFNDTLREYLHHLHPQEPKLWSDLRQETQTLEASRMQIGYDQARFMQMMYRLVNAKNIIEVGVFTGMSTLVAALSIPDDGCVVACDVSAEWTSIAKRYWKLAQVDHKIKLHLQPATDTLHELIQQGQANDYDAAFIDADKTNYETYYELCLTLLRPNGLILIDNTLWGGKVITTHDDDSEDTKALRGLNKKISQDPRVEMFLTPIGDGLSLVRKR